LQKPSAFARGILAALGHKAKKRRSMSRFVIVAYTPKLGKEQELLVAVKKHLNVLDAEKLITNKPAYVMRAVDGTIVEVFEWRSVDAIRQAHSNPAVQALWAEFASACDYTPLTKLAEAQQMFAEFDAVTL
jgi:hypothetical protein